jgi:hypothetical protein
MRAILLLTALIGASTVCADDLDIVFVVDGSTSVCENEPVPCPRWNAALQFIHDLVDTWAIGLGHNQVALVTAGYDVEVQWPLNRYTDKTLLLTEIDRVPYPGGDLGEADVTMVTADVLFTVTGGDRPFCSDVVVMITDGARLITAVKAEAWSTARQAKGTTVIVVCIQTGCDEEFAKSIASTTKENKKRYFLVGDYVDGNPSLDSIKAPLLAQINAIKNGINLKK